MTDIIKAYGPRQVQVKGVTYLVQELIILEDGQEKRTTKGLGRAEDFVNHVGDTGIPDRVYESLPERPGGSNGLLEGDCADSPGDCDESPQGTLPEALSVGMVVRHRLNQELLGRIVEIDTTSAKIELLTWPSEWWRRWYKTRPLTAFIEDLDLAE